MKEGLALEGFGATAMALAMIASFALAIGGHPTGGLALAWPDPSLLDPFAPPLAERGGYDFTITRLAP